MKTYIDKQNIKKYISESAGVEYDNIYKYLVNMKFNIDEVDIINYANKMLKEKKYDKTTYANKLTTALYNLKYNKKYIDIVKNKTLIYYKTLVYILDDVNYKNSDIILNKLDIIPDKNHCIKTEDINRLVEVIINNIMLLNDKTLETNSVNLHFAYCFYDTNVIANCAVYPTSNIILYNPFINDKTTIELSEEQKKLQKRNIFNKFINS